MMPFPHSHSAAERVMICWRIEAVLFITHELCLQDKLIISRSNPRERHLNINFNGEENLKGSCWVHGSQICLIIYWQSRNNAAFYIFCLISYDFYIEMLLNLQILYPHAPENMRDFFFNLLSDFQTLLYIKTFVTQSIKSQKVCWHFDWWLH